MRFEAVAEILLKGGIAPRHVRRYVRELDDHLDDLVHHQRESGHAEEDAASRARALLGSDAELSAAMLSQPGLRSWPARLPWLFFIVLPPLAVLALFFAAILPLVGLAHFGHMTTGQGIAAPEWFRLLARSMAFVGNLLLAPALSILLVAVALRQRLPMRWPLLAVSLIAVMGMRYDVSFPPSGNHGGQLGIGALLWLHHADTLRQHAATSLIQLALTLLPLTALLPRNRQSA